MQPSQLDEVLQRVVTCQACDVPSCLPPQASWLQRMFPRGGKMDDITVVVGLVVAA